MAPRPGNQSLCLQGLSIECESRHFSGVLGGGISRTGHSQIDDDVQFDDANGNPIDFSYTIPGFGTIERARRIAGRRRLLRSLI